MLVSESCTFHVCDDLKRYILSMLDYTQTYHFEYISESTASGLMSVQLTTNIPTVYGVLNCMDEDQVKARSSGSNNHGYDWGKTAVEMALLRNEAMNIKSSAKATLESMGFGKGDSPAKEKSAPAFF